MGAKAKLPFYVCVQSSPSYLLLVFSGVKVWSSEGK